MIDSLASAGNRVNEEGEYSFACLPVAFSLPNQISKRTKQQIKITEIE